TRKSIRAEVIEGDFEKLLGELHPTEGLFNLAFQMFRDLSDAKVANTRGQTDHLRKEIVTIGRQVDQLLDRIVDASSDSVVRAYEKRIKELEARKAAFADKIANSGKPIRSFGETYRTAFDFLANPSKLWHSPR